MSNGDNCRIKPGTWGLYIHHECSEYKRAEGPEYIPGTFESRKKEIAR